MAEVGSLADASLEQLQLQLQTYEQQLKDVRAQISASASPNSANPQLLEVQGDLQEGIDLMKDLIVMKQRGDKHTAASDQLQPNAIVQAYCSTLDAYINAQVVGSTQHGTCVVTLLGVTETLEVEVQSLRAGVPADPATLASGSKCDAVCDRTSFAAVCRVGDTAGRYSADGYFYKATVLKALYPGDLEYDVPYQTYAEKAGLSGVVRFKVQYDEYGNQETVDAYAVRPRAAGVAKAGGAVKKKKVGEKVVEQEDDADGDDGPKIPEHLRILPGDSDKVKENKKKRIHAIKSQYRMKKKEEEQTAKQSSWKSFDKSIGKKKVLVAGAISKGMKKTSMFATSEEGKVGVIGSGKAMTGYSDVARKWQPGDEDD